MKQTISPCWQHSVPDSPQILYTMADASNFNEILLLLASHFYLSFFFIHVDLFSVWSLYIYVINLLLTKVKKKQGKILFSVLKLWAIATSSSHF